MLKTCPKPLLIFSIFLAVLSAACEKENGDLQAERQLASFVFFRGNFSNVQAFKDTDYMHGLKYFHFSGKTEDIDRLVTWLRVKKAQSLPTVLLNVIEKAPTKTKWNFNWGDAQTYLAHYCHPYDGSNWSTDILLVKNGEAIFITEGSIYGATPTEDPKSCDNAAAPPK